MEKRKFDEIREAFEARLQELFVLCNGKTVVLWGYGCSGHFLDYAFQKRGKQIELRIDADGKKTGLERPCILAELNPETHIVLLSFPPSQDVIDQLERHGFRVGESYIPLVAWFYEDEVRPLGFHDWLEHVAHVDIRKREGEVNAKVKDFNEFSKSHDFMLDKVLRNFVFRPGDRIFDYGCGKGSALVLFERIDVPWGGDRVRRGPLRDMPPQSRDARVADGHGRLRRCGRVHRYRRLQLFLLLQFVHGRNVLADDRADGSKLAAEAACHHVHL